jgi:hypothetical protein
MGDLGQMVRGEGEGEDGRAIVIAGGIANMVRDAARE